MKRKKQMIVIDRLLLVFTPLAFLLFIIGWVAHDIPLLEIGGYTSLILIGINVVLCMLKLDGKIPRGVFIIPLLFLLQSCVQDSKADTSISSVNSTIESSQAGTSVFTYRGHDYLREYHGGITHDEACSNPIHNTHSGINIDLPEEWMEISSNSRKPDTLLGFYDNDTLYISFTGRHK